MGVLILSSEPDAAQSDLDYIENSIYAYNMRIVDDHTYTPIRIMLRDDTHTLHGGIAGGIWGGWFHINFLFVDEALRGQGYGAKLLLAAEDEARSKGVQHVYLETFSFQAKTFYDRYGYTVAGQIDDYPPGHTHYFMRKTL